MPPRSLRCSNTHIEEEIQRLRAELLRKDQDNERMALALEAEKEERERVQVRARLGRLRSLYPQRSKQQPCCAAA